VVVILLAMSVIASAVPAIRAAWVDPASTLRME
jgi:ABC-type lipoprotein release transport system permease subunit